MNKNLLGILLVALGLLFSCVDHNTFNAKIRFNNDTTAIGKHIRDSSIKAIKTPEGVWYIIETAGTGIYPVLSDSILIEYSMTNLQTNDQLYASGKLSVTDKSNYRLLSNLIAGLQIGLPRFPAGSYGKLYIPSGLAFGTAGNSISNVDQNTNLLFTVKKLTVAKGNHFTTDTTAIVKYLNTISSSLLRQNKVVINDPSGIRYWYDYHSANTTYPNLTDHSQIDVTYSTRVLNVTQPFDTLTVTNLDLTKQVAAWKIILPKIPEGSTVTMCVPSGYAYGSFLYPSDNTALAANSNLVYTVKVNTVH